MQGGRQLDFIKVHYLYREFQEMGPFDEDYVAWPMWRDMIGCFMHLLVRVHTVDHISCID